MFFLFEKLIFFGLIFSLPFQKRIFLFGADPAVAGEGFEWSSGLLYFTDFFIFILFVFCLVRCGRSDLPHRLMRSYSLPVIPALLMIFFAFAFVSLPQAELVDVGLYRFGKLAEFIFLFFYTVAYVGHRMSHIKHILWVFVASGLFQSIIAILQFAKQSSLGLEIFHESTLAIGLKGVAEISSGGVEFIRAYGTFPSPNVLAGFLGICLLFAFCLFLQDLKRRYYFLAHSRPSSDGLRGSGCFGPPSADTVPKQPSNPPESNSASSGVGVFLERYLLSLAIFILSFGLLLTFSRGVVIFFVFTSILFFAGMFLLKKFKEYRQKAIYLVGLVIVSWLLVIVALWPETSSRFLESSVNEPAIQERIFFNEIGIDTMRQNYTQAFFGVGMGNFVHNFMESVPGLPAHLYQPVHNIFILIASEIGIFGLVAFVLFLIFLIGKAVKILLQFSNYKDIQKNCGSINFVYVFSLLCVACFMLLVSMYDHYFWTLQQGGLMFWISLGLLASATSRHNKV